MSLYFNGYIKLTDSYAFLFALNYLVNLLLESSLTIQLQSSREKVECTYFFNVSVSHITELSLLQDYTRSHVLNLIILNFNGKLYIY